MTSTPKFDSRHLLYDEQNRVACEVLVYTRESGEAFVNIEYKDYSDYGPGWVLDLLRRLRERGLAVEIVK